jgi:hypothetical protein
VFSLATLEISQFIVGALMPVSAGLKKEEII